MVRHICLEHGAAFILPSQKQRLRCYDSVDCSSVMAVTQGETHDSASDEDAPEKILCFPRKFLRRFGHRRHRSRPPLWRLLRDVAFFEAPAAHHIILQQTMFPLSRVDAMTWKRGDKST